MKSAFPPIIDATCRILILGSMPGEASLQADQYYAFRHNAFWPIMTALLDLPSGLNYQDHCAALRARHIALWDVIERCEREGSLDTAIQHDTLEANDFSAFLAQYDNIHHIVFNGKSPYTLFKRHVMKKQVLPEYVQYHVMPSTSPANAAIRPEEKLQAWQETLLPILG